MKEPKIFALGFFDGVHLGHQALLTACRQLAEAGSDTPAAVTFDIPPAAILQETPPRMLNTLENRLELLRQYGMDCITVYPANARTLSVSWQDFLEDLLRQGAAGFVCGSDYRFGHKGAGNSQILRDFCDEKGLPCVIVPEQTLDGEKISSTRIRALLEQGQIQEANRLLGHPHILTGTVVSGQQLGRTIGIPTANLLFPADLLIPKHGVYACKVTVDNRTYPAVTNIGTRPTVGGNSVTAEAFLLDFSGDLYGKQLRIAFYAFLRPEKKFPDLEELKEEIQKNARQTREFFEKSE